MAGQCLKAKISADLCTGGSVNCGYGKTGHKIGEDNGGIRQPVSGLGNIAAGKPGAKIPARINIVAFSNAIWEIILIICIYIYKLCRLGCCMLFL
jgi:hypothetical protein